MDFEGERESRVKAVADYQGHQRLLLLATRRVLEIARGRYGTCEKFWGTKLVDVSDCERKHLRYIVTGETVAPQVFFFHGRPD